MTQQQAKDSCSEWTNYLIKGKSIRVITQETYGFRKQIEDDSEISRKEIRELLRAYEEAKHSKQ